MTEPTIDASVAWQKFRIDRLQTKLCQPSEIAQEQAILASLERLKSLDAQPVPMLLFCPHCGEQHIDEPDADKNWTNPLHRSHECQFCQWVWRPSDTATTGVLKLKTQGKVDKPARPRYFQTAADWENAIRSQPVARQGEHNGGDYDMRHTVEQPVPVEPDKSVGLAEHWRNEDYPAPSVVTQALANGVLRLQSALQRAQEKLKAQKDSAPLCDEHKPNGGVRGTCLVCACIKLSTALSRCDYYCDKPNEQEVSSYDIHCDQDAVVENVRQLYQRAEKAEATNRRMVELLKRLSFLAQTTGGTAGRDDELVKAIDESAELLKEVEK